MPRRHLLVALAAVAIAASAAALAHTTQAAAGADSNAAPVNARGPAATTTVSVTIGKPSEFRYTLSKKRVPVGTVVFKVVNKGRIAHDFKIAGKKTRMLAPGQSATLRVVLTKKGSYAYLCSVPGHAAAGMKGVLGVGAAPVTPPTPPSGGGNTGAACTNPVATTVQVEEWDYGFTLSQTTIPCGAVTFVQRNTGGVLHNFNVQGVANGQGALIDPGQATTMTVTFTNKGKFQFVCDVPHHIELGMVGPLTID
jgi:uncharacterized cupredoxin-like copper-binding protein